MTNIIYTKTYGAPPIDRREILRYMGVRSSAAEVEALLDECLRESEGIFTYKVCYRECPVSDKGEYLDLGFAKTNSSALKKNLEGCERVVVFVASVGTGIDRLIRRYSALSPAKSLIFGAVGTERVESLCDVFCHEVDSECRRKRELTRPRFSPGYGDLPLSLQKDVFAALDCPKKIGVSLGGSLLMSPSKSVSAIIGIRREE